MGTGRPVTSTGPPQTRRPVTAGIGARTRASRPVGSGIGGRPVRTQAMTGRPVGSGDSGAGPPPKGRPVGPGIRMTGRAVPMTLRLQPPITPGVTAVMLWWCTSATCVARPRMYEILELFVQWDDFCVHVLTKVPNAFLMFLSF